MESKYDDRAEKERRKVDAQKPGEERFATDPVRVLFPTFCSSNSLFAAQVINCVVRGRQSEVTVAYHGHHPPPPVRSKHFGAKLWDAVRAQIDTKPPQVENQLGDPPDNDDRLDRVVATMAGSNTDLTISRDTDIFDRDVIIAEACRNYSLVVLCVDEYVSQVGPRAFEDVVDGLIRKRCCPILVIKSKEESNESTQKEGEIRHILLPSVEHEFDCYAAEIAFSIATDSPSLVNMAQWIYPPRIDGYLIRHQHLQEKISLGKQSLDRTAEAGRQRNAAVLTDILVSNRPETDIVKHALNEDTDLIVLSPEGWFLSQRPSLSHWAEEVLRNAPCSILIADALDGFETASDKATSPPPIIESHLHRREMVEQDSENQRSVWTFGQKSHYPVNRRIRPRKGVN